MFQLLAAPLIGSAQPTGWAQVVSHPRHACVWVCALEGIQAHHLGHELVELFLQTEFASAVELHEFAQAVVQKAGAAQVQPQLALQLVVGESSILCTFQGLAYLQRSRKVGLLLSPKPEVHVVQGKTHAEDVYVLGTQSAGEYTQSIEAALGQTHDPDAFVTRVLEPVLEAADSSLVALAYVRVHVAAAGAAAGAVLSQVSSEKVQHENHTGILGSSLENDKQLSSSPSILSSSRLTRGSSARFTPRAFLRQLRRLIQPLFSRDVYVRQQNTKKIVRLAIPVAIALIVIGCIFGYWRVMTNRQLRAANAVVQPAQAELDAIQKLGADQQIAARTRTDTLLADLQSKLAQFRGQPTAQQVVQREIQVVQDYAGQISGQQNLDVLPTFFDLRLFQSDFLANHMDFQKGSIFFQDPDKKQILALDTSTKQTTLLPLGVLNTLKDFTVTDKSAFLLGDGVSVFTLGTNLAPTVLKPADADTGPATTIRAFGSYLYLLQPEKRNIFRYAVDGTNPLSSASAWLRPEEKFDLSTVASMSIDGDVWLGTKTGDIKRFTAGRTSSFAMVGLKQPFSGPLKIFTKDGLQNLYILEPGQNRVVVLSKDGTFQKEIRSNTLASASDIVADEASKTIFVLSGSLVYSLSF